MRRIAATLAALALAGAAAIATASPAHATVIQPTGLWTETSFTSAPAASHNTDCYKVTSTSYVCETAQNTSTYNWPGDNFYAVNHTKLLTTQHLTGTSGADWVCFNHGRPPGSINSSLTCFNPPDY